MPYYAKQLLMNQTVALPPLFTPQLSHCMTWKCSQIIKGETICCENSSEHLLHRIHNPVPIFKMTSTPLPWLGAIVLIVVSFLSCCSAILIESSDSSAPALYRGKQVNFKDYRFISCMCYRHTWALQITDVVAKTASWHVIGSNGPKCIQVGAWTKSLIQVADNTTAAGFAHLPTEEFLVVNGNNWQVELITGDHKGTKVCLPRSVAESYCLYKFNFSMIRDDYKASGFCEPGTPFLTPITCQKVLPSLSESEGDAVTEENLKRPQLVCDLIKHQRELHAHNRTKREDPVPTDPPAAGEVTTTTGSADGGGASGDTTTGAPGAGPGPGAGTEGGPPPKRENDFDEDYIASEDLPNYLTVHTMLDSTVDYVLSQITKQTGLKKGEQKSIGMLPVSELLSLSVRVTERFCPQIPTQVYEMALGAFLAEQRDKYYMKEPYIAYGPYIRIRDALQTCLEQAEPFEFFMNDTYSGDNDLLPKNATCGEMQPKLVTNYVLDKNNTRIYGGIEIPEYTVSDPEIHEPMIELTWKSFVNAHNYCFKHFQLYFNDHHTYTVSVMPFFTNRIQHLWYMGAPPEKEPDPEAKPEGEAKQEVKALNYRTKRVWHGGVLGNVSYIYWVMDRCLAANKAVNRHYPWFLNRPPRDPLNEAIFRKKRGLEATVDFDTNDIETSKDSDHEESTHDCECVGPAAAEEWEIEKCRSLRSESKVAL